MFHPAALVTGEGDGDDGIFSGCAIVTKEGIPALVYHGVGAGTCVAFAEDPEDEYLVKWQKNASNPVIAESRALEGVFNVFDPHCWLDEDGETYNMILGGRVKPYDIGDTAYLFRSRNLIDWEYSRPFYHPKTNPTPGDFSSLLYIDIDTIIDYDYETQTIQRSFSFPSAWAERTLMLLRTVRSVRSKYWKLNSIQVNLDVFCGLQQARSSVAHWTEQVGKRVFCAILCCK
jgi:hypothetical protein